MTGWDDVKMARHDPEGAHEVEKAFGGMPKAHAVFDFGNYNQTSAEKPQ